METTNLYQKLAELKKMSSLELRKLWAETFGKEAPNAYSVSMLATRLGTYFKNNTHALQESTLSTPKSKLIKYHLTPGVQRTRYYKGKAYVVRETQQGLEFQGQLYKSYSAIAMEITGQRRSGLIFFGLNNKPSQQARVFA